MRLEYVTHASIRIEAADTVLLTDPFYFLDPLIASFLCHYPDRAIKINDFPILDFVYLSHIHDDHCHRETLQKLKHKIKRIVLPAGKNRFEKKIRSYGFTDFIFLENEVTFELKPGLKVTSFHDKNGVDTALIIETEGFTVLHQNDCHLDLETFARMAKRFSIDYAFFPHTGNQELYPLLLPRPEEIWKRLSAEREEKGTRYLIDCLKILKPKTVIPYSFTIFYHNTDQLHLNSYNRTLPTEFGNRVQTECPEIKVLILQPGDQLEGKGKLRLRNPSQKNCWGKTLQEYIANGLHYVKTQLKAPACLSLGDPRSVRGGLKAYMKRRLHQSFPAYFYGEVIALHIYGAETTETYYLDVKSRHFSSQSDACPFLEIRIPASIIAAFLSKQFDSFMILYSYRIFFQCNALMLLGLKDEAECFLYIQALMALFDYDLYLSELANPWSPHPIPQK